MAEGQPIPADVTGAISADVLKRRRLVDVYRTQICALDSKIEHGVRIIKPGHRVEGVVGSGREATHIIAVPLTRRQIDNASRQLKILSIKLASSQMTPDF